MQRNFIREILNLRKPARLAPEDAETPAAGDAPETIEPGDHAQRADASGPAAPGAPERERKRDWPSIAAAHARHMAEDPDATEAEADRAIAVAHGISPVYVRQMTIAARGVERARSIDPSLAETIESGPHNLAYALSRWPEESIAAGVAALKQALGGERSKASFIREARQVSMDDSLRQFKGRAPGAGDAPPVAEGGASERDEPRQARKLVQTATWVEVAQKVEAFKIAFPKFPEAEVNRVIGQEHGVSAEQVEAMTRALPGYAMARSRSAAFADRLERCDPEVSLLFEEWTADVLDRVREQAERTRRVQAEVEAHRAAKLNEEVVRRAKDLARHWSERGDAFGASAARTAIACIGCMPEAGEIALSADEGDLDEATFTFGATQTWLGIIRPNHEGRDNARAHKWALGCAALATYDDKSERHAIVAMPVEADPEALKWSALRAGIRNFNIILVMPATGYDSKLIEWMQEP